MKTNEKHTATLLHLSALSQFIFPFGNYIFPLIIWGARKKDSEFVDYNGKQVLNFQLSILTYSLVMLLISIPVFLYRLFQNIDNHINTEFDDFCDFTINGINSAGIIMIPIIAVMLFCLMKIFQFVIIIYGAIKASNGEKYRYPLSINYLK